MNVDEAQFLEVLVDRIADAIPHPGDRAEGVGPRAEMGDGPQELEAVLLLLQRVTVGVGEAVDREAPGLDLGGLTAAGRFASSVLA